MDKRTQQKGQGQAAGNSQESSPLLRNHIHLWLPWLAQTALFSQKCLPSLPVCLAEISASPHLLFLPQGILSSISSLHLMLSTSAKILFRKTNVYGCAHNIGKYTSQSIKEAGKMFCKLLHKAHQPCHGEVCILTRAHRDHPVPKKIWNAELLPYAKLHTTPGTTWWVNPTHFSLAESWHTTKPDIHQRCLQVASDQGSLN